MTPPHLTAPPGPTPRRVRRSDPGNARLALAALAILTVIWAWWAWRRGAFFATVSYPGELVLLAMAATLCALAPWRGRMKGAPAAALAGLVLLAAWSLLSVLWTPARDVALEDAHRTAIYAAAFLVGLWLCHLLGRRMALSVLPLAVAGGVVGAATVAVLWTGSNPQDYLETDATLKLPIGYRNANAAFFMVAFWPALVLAGYDGIDRWLRGAMLATATLCLELAILSQSRGAAIAATVSLIVYFVAARSPVRAGAFLLLAVVPAVAALPSLLDVFHSGTNGGAALPPLHGAARMMAVTTVLGFGLGVAAVMLEAGVQASTAATRQGRRALVALAAGVILIGGAFFVRGEGDPGGWLADRWQEFKRGGNPDLSASGSRFVANAGSNRYDFWRVALGSGEERPLLGQGAGGWQYSYFTDRKSPEQPKDAHSVEFQAFSELGLPGLAFFFLFAAGAISGAVRSRRLGPAAAAISGAALASGSYWLVHASVDWLWEFPGLTAPVIGLLGAACAPAVLMPAPSFPSARRRVAAAGIAVVAVTALPLYLSARYADTAKRQVDANAAFADLDRSEALNPLADEPFWLEGVIARDRGDRDRALEAFRRAGDREAQNWAPHFWIGEMLIESDPAAAARSLETARRLNPRNEQVREVLDRLRRARRDGSRSGR